MTFDDLSFSFAMGLYRLKESALENNDLSAINSLKVKYPMLFTDDFSKFISQLKDVIEYFKVTQGIDFGEIVEDEDNSYKSTQMH
jgi:hypothetical protein